MGSNRMKLKLLTLFSLFFTTPCFAESGSVSVTGSGRDSAEAMVSLLKSSVARYFKTDQNLVKPILQYEILPNAASFVQSYKMLEGSRGGSVTISANVDLDVLRGLFSLTPKSLDEAGSTKALIYVRPLRMPESAKNINPYAVLENAVKERFLRRQFVPVLLSAEEISSITQGEEGAGPEVLRGLATKSSARVAVGITSRLEKIENENSHKDEERIFLSAILLDAKSGTIIGKSSANFLNPTSKKEQYVSDLQRVLLEESRDLLQDLFVSGGKKITPSDNKEAFSILRVIYPSNPGLVTKFRALLETVKGTKSVVEYQIRRGSYDFAIHPAIEAAVLTKYIKGFVSEEIAIEVLPKVEANELDSKAPILTVKIIPKAAPADPGMNTTEGGAREKF